MKKMMISLAIFVCTVNLYSMRQPQAQDFLEKLVKKWPSEQAIKHIKELKKDFLNRLDYSVEVTTRLPVYDENGATISGRLFGFSLLHFVVAQNRYDLIEAFKDAGANFVIQSTKNTGSMTPLKLALQKRHWYCVIELLKTGITGKDDHTVKEIIAMIIKTRDNIFVRSSEIQDDIIKLLIKNGDLSVRGIVSKL